MSDDRGYTLTDTKQRLLVHTGEPSARGNFGNISSQAARTPDFALLFLAYQKSGSI
jgi:hypothetical protein